MPLCLSEDMTDVQLLRAVADAYATNDNWEEFEKDVGGQRAMVMRSWTSRDNGDYARRALRIMATRPTYHCGACQVTSYAPFKIGPVVVPPCCRNDACPTMWWNR